MKTTLRTFCLLFALLPLSLHGQTFPSFSALPALTTAASNDGIAIYDNNGSGIYTLKRISFGDLKTSLNLTSGTVTSVQLAMPAGLTVTGGPITASGTITVSTTLNGLVLGNGSGFTTATIGTGLSLAGGTLSIGDLSGTYQPLSATLTTLGGLTTTATGRAFLTLANPGAIAFPRVNADNTVSVLDAATFRTSLSLGNVENTALSSWPGSTAITTLGTISAGTVPVARVSGLAASATTDTTNAANITSGTLPDARLSSVIIKSTGSYADPAWITSLAGSKLTGTVTATNGVVTTGNYADPAWITSLAFGKVLPTVSGQSGKFLTNNGSALSWGAAGTGDLLAANNLSELTATASTARANINAQTAHANLLAISAGTWTGAGSITTVGTLINGNASASWEILNNGTVGGTLILTTPSDATAIPPHSRIRAGALTAMRTLATPDKDGVIATTSDTIPSGNISGLGTMATQNASAVAITGGNWTSSVTTGTTTMSGAPFIFTNLTTGTGLYAANSTLTSGKLVDLQVSGTSIALTNNTVLNVAAVGSTSGATQTTYGARISNTRTGTTPVNVGLELTASGGTTNRALLVAAGDIVFPESSSYSLRDSGSRLVIETAGNGINLAGGWGMGLAWGTNSTVAGTRTVGLYWSGAANELQISTGVYNNSGGHLKLTNINVQGTLLVGGLSTFTGRIIVPNAQMTHSTLTYAATTTVDFTGDGFKTVSLAGNVTFATSNLAAGRSVTARIVADGSLRTFTFPAGWKFLGAAAPASIAASKTAILTMTAFGTADTDVVAAYSVEP